MLRLVAALSLALVGLAPRPGTAQSGLAGTWITEFDIGIRNENGVETSMGKRQATLILAVAGDSVTGTWQPKGDGNGPAPSALHVRGTRSGAKVALAGDPVERTVSINGDDQRVKMMTTWSFELRGDTLEGTTRTRALDGSFEGTDRPFTAKREKP
jgi:hypothetical protein